MKQQLSDDEVLVLYRAGLTITRIAELGGVTRQAMQQRLRKLGAEPRSQGEWARKGRE